MTTIRSVLNDRPFTLPEFSVSSGVFVISPEHANEFIEVNQLMQWDCDKRVEIQNYYKAQEKQLAGLLSETEQSLMSQARAVHLEDNSY